MSDSHMPATAGRDSNDEKIMATSPGNVPGRTINASNTTLNNTPNSPVEAYFEFPSSTTKSFDTYSKRMETLSKALGNIDSVKG